ncbi:MAG TPA: hypothetical protein VHR66_14220 [Gemmataceae bacterium]|jgi:hypothetical protein|nr:hypothetical protein [Gemmataceae bacterium]
MTSDTRPHCRTWRLIAPLAVLLLLSPSGCDSGSGSLHKVSGKVTVDGAPLTTGTVRFVPDKDKGNKATTEPTGQIGTDGTYSLMTDGKSGAPAGWYKVTISASEVPESSKPFSGKSLVAAKFNDPAASGLAVEVVSSPKAGAYDLQATAK